MVKRAKLLFVVVALLPMHQCHPMLSLLSRSATTSSANFPPRASLHIESGENQLLYRAIRRLPDEAKIQLTQEMTEQMRDTRQKDIARQWPTLRNQIILLAQTTRNAHQHTLNKLLSIAVQRNDPAVTLYLLGKKANPNALNKQELPIIFDAKTKRMAQTLIAHGEGSHGSKLPWGQTIFHHIVAHGYSPDLISFYNAKQLSIFHQDRWGENPLHCLTRIARNTHTKSDSEKLLIKACLLLKHGASPDALNRVNCPPDEILRITQAKPNSVQSRLFECLLTLFDEHRKRTK